MNETRKTINNKNVFYVKKVANRFSGNKLSQFVRKAFEDRQIS